MMHGPLSRRASSKRSVSVFVQLRWRRVVRFGESIVLLVSSLAMLSNYSTVFHRGTW